MATEAGSTFPKAADYGVTPDVIRTWAAEQNIDVPQRGRLRGEVITAWAKANRKRRKAPVAA